MEFNLGFKGLTALGLHAGTCNENTASAGLSFVSSAQNSPYHTYWGKKDGCDKVDLVRDLEVSAPDRTEPAKKQIRTPPLSLCWIVAGEIETPRAHLILPYFVLPEIFVVSTRAAGARLGTRRGREGGEKKRKDCCCFGWRTKFTRSCITGCMLNFLRGSTASSKKRAE